MEFELQKKEQQMLIYWEHSASGIQEANYDIEDNEGCEIHKPQMKNVEDQEQIDPAVNTIFIFDL
jgi:hypothetical protein